MSSFAFRAACAGVVATLALGARPLAAQDPAAPSTAGDSSVRPLQVDGARIRPRGSLYDVLVTADSGTRHVGWHTVWVFAASFSGRPAWEILERRASHAPFAIRVTQDSSVLHRESLVPLRWEAVTGDARLVAAFTNDTVYGGATSPRARSTFTVPFSGATLTSEGALDVALQGAPLTDGWQATTAMLAADLSGARTIPVSMSVERTESVEVPAGRFDAWVVRVTAPGVERTVWVDRITQVVVKTSERPPHMPDAVVERVFVGGY